MILVTGATGNIGSHLVRELAGSGVPVRALVRKSRDHGALCEHAVEVALGAFEDAESLRAAMVGVEQVFVLGPAGVETMVEQQLSVLRAAQASESVRHIVKLSSIAADEPRAPAIVAAHRRIEEAIERSGFTWTHLRPNRFMQSELGHADDVALEGDFYAPDITHVSMIDARDIAAIAACVLTSDGHDSRAYTLTGPEALSYAEVADVYSRVLATRIRWEPLSIEEARASMLKSGLPAELAVGFSEIMLRYRDGGITRQISPDVEQLLGRPPRTFEQFVHDHRNAYDPRLPR
jgi:uncharacterized protein YbjT (DUF2867 family)